MTQTSQAKDRRLEKDKEKGTFHVGIFSKKGNSIQVNVIQYEMKICASIIDWQGKVKPIIETSKIQRV